jgi:murein DD-endopeptidase MepM/ murein hydrolase activator NlpD
LGRPIALIFARRIPPRWVLFVAMAVLAVVAIGHGGPSPASEEPPAADFEQQLDAHYFVFAHTEFDAARESAVEPERRAIRAAKGDTFMAMLVKADIPRREAHEAIGALRKVYNPRNLMPGQTIELSFMPDRSKSAPARFLGLSFEPNAERAINVARTWNNGFKAQVIKKKLTLRLVRAAGSMDNSLYVDTNRAAVPAPVVAQLIGAYSFDIDFQRDIQRGDAFDVIYEQYQDKDGRTARNGNVVYAALNLSGVTLQIYRYELAGGVVGYFNEKGESVRKALMRTPVDGARLSSRYGRRRHPILGYTRMHRGVDFAARRGTPVMAAGSGVIARAGHNGAYGRYIKIRHNGTYATAYGHLNRYARNIRAGKRVRQGQIIGYVGSTGRSTGPHLHYEVHRNNRQMNPMKLRLPTGNKLTGKRLARFRKFRAEIDQKRASLPVTSTVASSR